MALRVTVEVVPFGDEEGKYTIGVANISNVGGEDICNYDYTFKGDIGVASGTIYNHNRNDGALELIQRVIASISNQV